MDAGAVIAVLIFLAANTGSMIYFAGIVTATLRDHDRRIGSTEEWRESRDRVIFQLAGKEGIDV